MFNNKIDIAITGSFFQFNKTQQCCCCWICMGSQGRESQGRSTQTCHRVTYRLVTAEQLNIITKSSVNVLPCEMRQQLIEFFFTQFRIIKTIKIKLTDLGQ
eukprot:GHVO01016734.1.p1 GENE.GHVO01016734.1~~GHVO01016734.1.p1  ORF type:complete len:101 (-),score=1.50 GHVO01016734.1:104-406(-)